MISPEEAIAVINAAFGRHPGYRALHAKGAFYRATFTATLDGAKLTRAAHMQGEPVEATVRFSNGSGNPSHPDYLPDVRGMASTFHLPDGSRTDISAQSAPRFPVSTPEAFIELVRANSGGAARLWRLPLFIARHPSAARTLGVNATALGPPTSYATISYFAIHAFKWLDAHGGARYVRYRWKPDSSEPRLKLLEARRRGRDYLQQELSERLRQGPIQFSLVLQVAAEGDDVDDPASVWPEDRETVTAGMLKVTGPHTLDEASGPLVFDPLRLTDGIEPSNDPVLSFRPRAYSISAERRAGAGSA